MWSLTTLTGLFYSLNQHYIAREAEEPAEGPVEPVEPVEPGEPVEPVEPVPPERGPVPQGRRSRPEQAGAAGAGRGSRGAGAGRGSRAAGRLAKKKKKKRLTDDLIAYISGGVARGSALLATRRPSYAIKFGFSLTT